MAHLFIVSFPINSMVIFHSYGTVYQRVIVIYLSGWWLIVNSEWLIVNRMVWNIVYFPQ